MFMQCNLFMYNILQTNKQTNKNKNIKNNNDNKKK